AQDALLTAVRRAMRLARQTGLCEIWSGNVAIVTAGQADWDQVCGVFMSDVGIRCHIGVGGACARPAELPRSLREAGLALRLQKTLLHGGGAGGDPKPAVFRWLA